MVNDPFDAVVKEIRDSKVDAIIPESKELESYFFQQMRFAGRITFQEKEILLFSFLQILFTILGYFLWLVIIHILSGDYSFSATPPSPESASASSYIISLILITLLIAIPIGILNACIGTVYLLRLLGRQSTILDCFSIVFSKLRRILFFYLTDTRKTVLSSLDLFFSPFILNKEKLVSEYQAWKLATIGILPSLLNGNDTTKACSESVLLVKKHSHEVTLLYYAYQRACTVLCVFPTLWFIYWYATYTVSAGTDMFEVGDLFLWLGVPVIISLVLIQLFLRPIFILTAVKLYGQTYKVDLKNKNEELSLPEIKE